MIGIRMLLIFFMCVVGGYSLMVESAEDARKNNNWKNEWRNEIEIKVLNDADIARRTQKDIEWHNQRELAYRKRREALARDQRRTQ